MRSALFFVELRFDFPSDFLLFLTGAAPVAVVPEPDAPCLDVAFAVLLDPDTPDFCF